VFVFLCQADAAGQKQDASANDPLAQCGYSPLFAVVIVTLSATTKSGKAGQAGIRGILSFHVCQLLCDLRANREDVHTPQMPWLAISDLAVNPPGQWRAGH
jgi:hypothetical protein